MLTRFTNPPLNPRLTPFPTRTKICKPQPIPPRLSIISYNKTAKEIPEDPETQLALGLLWQSIPRVLVLMLSQAVGLPNMVT
jgi:hypothetical protein